jgi:hypothetical protein
VAEYRRVIFRVRFENFQLEYGEPMPPEPHVLGPRVGPAEGRARKDHNAGGTSAQEPTCPLR